MLRLADSNNPNLQLESWKIQLFHWNKWQCFSWMMNQITTNLMKIIEYRRSPSLLPFIKNPPLVFSGSLSHIFPISVSDLNCCFPALLPDIEIMDFLPNQKTRGHYTCMYIYIYHQPKLHASPICCWHMKNVWTLRLDQLWGDKSPFKLKLKKFPCTFHIWNYVCNCRVWIAEHQIINKSSSIIKHQSWNLQVGGFSPFQKY